MVKNRGTLLARRPYRWMKLSKGKTWIAERKKKKENPKRQTCLATSHWDILGSEKLKEVLEKFRVH